MKFGSSAKSFATFFCLLILMLSLTLASCPTAYALISGAIMIFGKVTGIPCAQYSAPLMKFPADNGSVTAANSMGRLYYFGMGVPQSYPLARKYLIIAANKADADAQELLGYIATFGGNKIDYPEAFKWVSKAANQGMSSCQSSLGDMYFTGNGVSRDVDQSFKWYLKAADQSDPYACLKVGNCYEYGIGTKRNDELATKYYRKAADQGFGEAQYKLAVRLINGNGCKPSSEEAMGWLSKAAEQENCHALVALGELDQFVMFGSKDTAKISKLFRRLQLRVARTQSFSPGQDEGQIRHELDSRSHREVRPSKQPGCSISFS